jgi:hypothetical protein
MRGDASMDVVRGLVWVMIVTNECGELALK